MGRSQRLLLNVTPPFDKQQPPGAPPPGPPQERGPVKGNGFGNGQGNAGAIGHGPRGVAETQKQPSDLAGEAMPWTEPPEERKADNGKGNGIGNGSAKGKGMGKIKNAVVSAGIVEGGPAGSQGRPSGVAVEAGPGTLGSGGSGGSAGSGEGGGGDSSGPVPQDKDAESTWMAPPRRSHEYPDRHATSVELAKSGMPREQADASSAAIFGVVGNYALDTMAHITRLFREERAVRQGERAADWTKMERFILRLFKDEREERQRERREDFEERQRERKEDRRYVDAGFAAVNTRFEDMKKSLDWHFRFQLAAIGCLGSLMFFLFTEMSALKEGLARVSATLEAIAITLPDSPEPSPEGSGAGAEPRPPATMGGSTGGAARPGSGGSAPAAPRRPGEQSMDVNTGGAGPRQSAAEAGAVFGNARPGPGGSAQDPGEPAPGPGPSPPASAIRPPAAADVANKKDRWLNSVSIGAFLIRQSLPK